MASCERCGASHRKKCGLLLEDVVSGARSVTQVSVTERLSSEDYYDMALITVRWDQLSDILPVLSANQQIPSVLFMLNNPAGSTGLIEALGADRGCWDSQGQQSQSHSELREKIVKCDGEGEMKAMQQQCVHAVSLRALGFAIGFKKSLIEDF
jgi:hypothetical protein